MLNFPKIPSWDKVEAGYFNFCNPIIATEKIDGSAISFYKLEDQPLVIRSKHQILSSESPKCEKRWSPAIQYLKSIEDKIPKNYIFFGEYLEKPRHNHLSYERIPKNHIILYGMYHPLREDWVDIQRVKSSLMHGLGLEVVPVLFADYNQQL